MYIINIEKCSIQMGCDGVQNIEGIPSIIKVLF